MNLFPGNSIEYQLIEKLQKKSWTTVDLIHELQKNPKTPTKQAVYLAIRKLKKYEIIVTTKKRISLSVIWIEKMHLFFVTAKNSYAEKSIHTRQSESFLTLEEGDRISYEFKHLETADIFWGHAFSLLASNMQSAEPVYLYNPHEWFFLARSESENHIMRQCENDGHPWIIYIAGTTKLDLYTKTLINKPSVVYAHTEQFFKRNHYINVFGDFLIEATIDAKTQEAIDTFYKKYEKLDESSKQKIQSITTDLRGRIKIVISRNKKKSEKIKRLFKKYF